MLQSIACAVCARAVARALGFHTDCVVAFFSVSVEHSVLVGFGCNRLRVEARLSVYRIVRMILTAYISRLVTRLSPSRVSSHVMVIVVRVWMKKSNDRTKFATRLFRLFR